MFNRRQSLTSLSDEALMERIAERARYPEASDTCMRLVKVAGSSGTVQPSFSVQCAPSVPSRLNCTQSLSRRRARDAHD